MNFNPLFLQSTPGIDNIHPEKTNKLSGSGYLFSDIINVFMNTDENDSIAKLTQEFLGSSQIKETNGTPVVLNLLSESTLPLSEASENFQMKIEDLLPSGLKKKLAKVEGESNSPISEKSLTVNKNQLIQILENINNLFKISQSTSKNINTSTNDINVLDAAETSGLLEETDGVFLIVETPDKIFNINISKQLNNWNDSDKGNKNSNNLYKIKLTVINENSLMNSQSNGLLASIIPQNNSQLSFLPFESGITEGNNNYNAALKLKVFTYENSVNENILSGVTKDGLSKMLGSEEANKVSVSEGQKDTHAVLTNSNTMGITETESVISTNSNTTAIKTNENLINVSSSVKLTASVNDELKTPVQTLENTSGLTKQVNENLSNLSTSVNAKASVSSELKTPVQTSENLNGLVKQTNEEVNNVKSSVKTNVVGEIIDANKNSENVKNIETFIKKSVEVASVETQNVKNAKVVEPEQAKVLNQKLNVSEKNEKVALSNEIKTEITSKVEVKDAVESLSKSNSKDDQNPYAKTQIKDNSGTFVKNPLKDALINVAKVEIKDTLKNESENKNEVLIKPEKIENKETVKERAEQLNTRGINKDSEKPIIEIKENENLNLKVSKAVKNISTVKTENAANQNNEKPVKENSETKVNKTDEKVDTAPNSNSNEKNFSNNNENSPKQSDENKQVAFNTNKINTSDIKEKFTLDAPTPHSNSERIVKVTEMMKEISKFIEKQENSTLTIKINPEELGKVKITMDVSEQSVRANIHVENEAVKTIVEKSIAELQNQLSKSGIQLSSVNVMLSDSEQKTAKQFANKKKTNSFEMNDKNIDEADEEKVKMMGYNTVEYLA